MEEGDDQQVQKKVLQSSNLISLFSDLIDSNPLIQDDFPSSSILKLKSVIIGSCLEIEKQFLQLSLLFQQTHQQLIVKIHQLKLKLIQDIEGISSSSSNQQEQQQEEEKRKCSIEENGLIGIISSFFQKLLQSTSSSSSSSSDQSQDGMEMKYFDGWNDLDVEIFLEETGTKKSTIELIKTRLIKSNINNNNIIIIENQQQQNLIGIIKQIYHQLLQSLLESSSSSSKKKRYQEILSNVKQLLPEEKSRLLLGLELISKRFGIINIPNWWMENEIKKPLEERNLMSINNGNESIINWIHLKLPDLIK